MISDSFARQTALLPERSFIVQAPAGSGKTGLLVYRLLVLLTRVERPEQILAITFTRKATSEMQQRLLELLQMAEEGVSSNNAFEQQGIELAKAVLQQDRHYGWKLLDAPHQLQIQTIDSFCGKLTGHMPWLSRLGDRPRTTDRADIHYMAAIEQLFNELLGEPSELSTSLQQVMLELDFDYGRARNLFSAMLSRRDQWLRHFVQNDLTKMRSDIEQVWSDIVDEHCALLAQMLPESVKRASIMSAQKAAEYIARDYPKKISPFSNLNNCDDLQNFDKEQWLAIRHLFLTGDGGLRKPRGVNKTLGFPTDDIEHKERFLVLLSEFEGDISFVEALNHVQDLPPKKFSDGDWQQLLALEKVLKSLAGLLQLRFRSVGECDHSEVTQRANLALHELQAPTDLALRMDYQINHILVDEFQDTSHGQLQLLRKLTLGWDREDSSRSMLLVGDPMQSIYRFREADVSLFLQVVNNDQTRVFENINIESLKLSENFRSNGRMVDWFNNVFESSFPQTNDVLSGAISYAPASYQAELIHEKTSSVVETSLVTNNLDEMANIVASVNTFLDTAPKTAKLGILVRSRRHLIDILPALQDAGIDYSAVDIQPLAKAQAVIDVMALTKAICRLDNRIAWLSLLRGPWCGLTLVEIKRIATNSSNGSRKGEQQPVWQTLNEFDLSCFEADTQLRLKRFCKVMQEALAQRQQVGLHSIVRWSWQSLGGEQTLFGTSVDDIYELFDLIEHHQDGGDIMSTNDLDKALEGLYARPQTNSARVLVSTIHKAKGLQYHTVILPCLSRQSKGQEKDIFMWAERVNNDHSQLLLAPIRLAGDDLTNAKSNSNGISSHYDYLRWIEKRRATNEVIRLMYVACTRAEEKLILTAMINVDEDKNQAKAPIKSSLLASIWNSVECEFEYDSNLNQHQDSSLEPVISQTLLRLPSDFEVPKVSPLKWQPQYQLQSKEGSQEKLEQQALEFGWATEVATSVGIVMHDWLQFNQQTLLDVQINEQTLKKWRQRLAFMGVSNNRLAFAVERLHKGVKLMQADIQAHFLFKDYAIQKNEMALATFENGMVHQYRIDRTFVDENDTRWIVDYKTTYTQAENIDSFVDQQIADRHKEQLQKYGNLMSKIDSRTIKLAVYFPMLSRLRSWQYEGS